MFCRNCGAQMADNMSFCTRCGQPLAKPAPTAAQPGYPPAARPGYSPAAQPGYPPAAGAPNGAPAASQLKISPSHGQRRPYAESAPAAANAAPAAPQSRPAAQPGFAPVKISPAAGQVRTEPAPAPGAAPVSTSAPAAMNAAPAAPQSRPAAQPGFAPVGTPAPTPAAPGAQPAFRPTAAEEPRAAYTPAARPVPQPGCTPANPSAPQPGFAPENAAAPSAPAGYTGAYPAYSAANAPSPQRPAAPAPAKKKSGAGKAILGVIAALLAIALIGGGVWYFFLRDKGDAKKNAAAQSGGDSQDAVDELLDYIDQAEGCMTKAMADYSQLDTQSPTYFNEYSGIISTYQSEIGELQKKANDISGLSPALDAAQKEYFSILYDGAGACVEHCDFYAAYMEFYRNYLSAVPRFENYPETNRYDFSNYYTDYDAWNTETLAAYAAISPVPDCLKPLWEQYGKVFDLSGSILSKCAHAHNYDDPLCAQSAKNMFGRFTAEIDRQYDRIWSCSQGEVDLVKLQNTAAAEIANSIREYAELDEDHRADYTFVTRQGALNLDYSAVSSIYPALYSTYDEFVILKAGCLSGSRTITVEAEIPGFSQPYQQTYVVDSAYQEIYLKPPALSGDLNLTSAKDAQIQIRITDKDGSLIESKNFPITIMSKYDFSWSMDEQYGIVTRDNILCYLTPGATVISEIRRAAIDEISDITSGTMESFVGYQDSYYSRALTTYLHAAGIMRALNTHGVRYSMDPFSIDDRHQHILLPEDVWNQKSGLCIETALTVASTLQSADMHVFLLLPPGHAQVAVEVWNEEDGAGEYYLIETTILTDDANNRDVMIRNWDEYKAQGTYPIMSMSRSEWQSYVSSNGTYIIDCSDAPVLGMTPFTN